MSKYNIIKFYVNHKIQLLELLHSNRYSSSLLSQLSFYTLHLPVALYRIDCQGKDFGFRFFDKAKVTFRLWDWSKDDGDDGYEHLIKHIII